MMSIGSGLPIFCAPISKSNVFELTPRNVIYGGAGGFVPFSKVIVRRNVPKLLFASHMYSPNNLVLFK